MKNIFLLIVGSLLIGCSNETLTFSTQTWEQKSKLPCKEVCTQVKIKVPFANDDSKVAKSVNQHILNTVKEVVYFGENPNKSATYPEITQSFITAYEDMKKQFPAETIGWEALIEGKKTYQNEALVAIQIGYYNYTGGAHGYSGIKSILINKDNGTLHTPQTLFKDLPKFKKFAEKAFRKHFEIADHYTINATGFMFNEDKFELPNTLIFNEKGLILYYNTYEISSYTNGPKQLFLPYTKIKDYLSFKPTF